MKHKGFLAVLLLASLSCAAQTTTTLLCFAKTPAGFGINDIVAVVTTGVLV